MVQNNKVVNEIISEVAGEDVLPVVDYLKGKKNISEFKIAQDIALEVNRIRNILYRLHKYNIVTYHRKKDRIKGWYISYWTLNPSRIGDIRKQLLIRKIDMLKEKLAKEEANQNSFFLCPNMCVRQDFDQATEFEFRCPECGNLLHQQDNTRTIDNLKSRISELEKELKERNKAEAMKAAKLAQEIEEEELKEAEALEKAKAAKKKTVKKKAVKKKAVKKKAVKKKAVKKKATKKKAVKKKKA